MRLTSYWYEDEMGVPVCLRDCLIHGAKRNGNVGQPQFLGCKGMVTTC